MQAKFGIEIRAAKPNKPVASKVVTWSEMRPRRVLSDIGNLGCHAAKPSWGDEIKPEKFGVEVKNKSATTRASSMACNYLSSNYMLSHADINQKMRGILIDWLIDVHLKFELMHETLFLMINLIDIFLSMVYTITRKDLQLVGLTVMLVAAKYEVWAPKVKELITISNNVYTCGEVLFMEKLMLNKLRFNLAVRTPFVFMKRFLKAAQADKKLEEMAFYLVELCLVEYETLKWKPSMQRMPAWTRLVQKHAHYRESELKECGDMIAGFHENAEEGDLKAVYNKYLSSQFGGVAKLPFAASPLLGNYPLVQVASFYAFYY